MDRDEYGQVLVLMTSLRDYTTTPGGIYFHQISPKELKTKGLLKEMASGRKNNFLIKSKALIPDVHAATEPECMLGKVTGYWSPLLRRDVHLGDTGWG